jgi:hypothetical protein
MAIGLRQPDHARDAMNLLSLASGYKYQVTDANDNRFIVDMPESFARGLEVPSEPDIIVSGYNGWYSHEVWVLGEPQIRIITDKGITVIKGGQAILRISSISLHANETYLTVRDRTLLRTKSFSHSVIGLWVLKVFKVHEDPNWRQDVAEFYARETRTIPPDNFLMEAVRIGAA